MTALLRLALFNPIDPARPLAERELALRLTQALETLGWQGAILSRSSQVVEMNPDGVLCLHPQATGKLTDHPWLACYWNPPALLKGDSQTARTHGELFELTHDAYLVSGPVLEAHLAGLMAQHWRDPPMLPFHVSSPRSTLSPNRGAYNRLFYVGSNWDGRRYPTLLRHLTEAGALALHGTQERWAHLPEAYQGPLPFDGRSVISAAHHWGMGLCLHLPQHRAAGVPNMRVFELAAAGAVIIADRHPFIERWFADTVLYVDAEGGEEAMADRILEQVAWVQAHPAAACAMAAAAQAIFNRQLCLEALLEPLPDLLAGLKHRRPRPAASVGVLLPGDGDLDGRLAQLREQAEEGSLIVTALLPVGSGPRPEPGAGVTLRDLAGPTGLMGLLAALDGIEMVAVLPEGVEWHAGHLANLVARADRTGAVMVAGLWPRTEQGQGFPIDPAEDRALPSPDRGPDDRRLALAWLRAGGLCSRVERLRGLVVDSRDWLALALDLAPALASAGELARVPVPGLHLTSLPRHDARYEAALRPWPATGQEVGNEPALPLRVTGINDLDPDLAASIAVLWRPADFAALPVTGPLWLYGSGLGGKLVHDGLPDKARARLCGFLDSHHQGEVLGLPLKRPQDLDPIEMASATIIIAAQYVSDILRVLQRGAVAPCHILNAYPYIAERQQESGGAHGL